MRLLQLSSQGDLSLTKNLTDIPQYSYAILSHTWGDDEDEVTFEDIGKETMKAKAGYRKIKFCGERARRDGLRFFWVDTCCIKKSDNNELATAINSMFRWYQNAKKCYVYLADVSVFHKDDKTARTVDNVADSFRASRWFTRGWTLQELIAPESVEFFSSDELLLGDKKSLKQVLWEITNIPARGLLGSNLSEFTVAERMSWASARQTKLEEDKVYCLMGLFEVYLPLIYGEGLSHARERFQFDLQRHTVRQPRAAAEPPVLESPNTRSLTHHPVRRNYRRVHVTIIYWEVDKIDDLVRSLCGVFGRIYLYEVESICLTPAYSSVNLDFPWQDSASINDEDLQILYYIGATQDGPEEAPGAFGDLRAVSHSRPNHTLKCQPSWLSAALGIPNLCSDVLVVLDCYWAGLSEDRSSSMSSLAGGQDWARYGVIFAGYDHAVSPLGRFSERLLNVLQNLANSIGDHATLVSCADVVIELRKSLEQLGDEVVPDWRGSVGAASFVLAPLWA